MEELLAAGAPSMSKHERVMFCIADNELNKRYSLFIEDKLFFRAFRDEVFAVACDDGFELELREFTRLFDQAERRRIRANAAAERMTDETVGATQCDSIATAASTPSFMSPTSPMYISTVQRQNIACSPTAESPRPNWFHLSKVHNVANSVCSNSNAKSFCLLEGENAPAELAGHATASNETAKLPSSYQTVTESLYQSMELDSSLFFAVAREAYELSRDPLVSGRSGNIWRWEGHCAAFQCCAQIFARIYDKHVRPVDSKLGTSLDNLSISGAIAFRSAVRKYFRLPLDDPLSYHQNVLHSESNLDMKWIDYYIRKDKHLFPEHGQGVSRTKCEQRAAPPPPPLPAAAATTAVKAVKTNETPDVKVKPAQSASTSSAQSSRKKTASAAPTLDLTLSYMPTKASPVSSNPKSSASKKGKNVKATSATSNNSSVSQNSVNTKSNSSCAPTQAKPSAAKQSNTPVAQVHGSDAKASAKCTIGRDTSQTSNVSVPNEMCGSLPESGDENNLQTFWLSQLLSTPSWEADDLTTYCRECNRVFSSLTHPLGSRAHHCRCCGRRLCGSCITKKAHRSFAKLSKPGDAMEGDMRLVCNRCYEQYRKLEKLRYLGALFAMAGLDFRQLSLCRTVGWQWRQAAELCISEYRYLLHTCKPDFSSVLTPVGVFLQNSLHLILSIEDASKDRTPKATSVLPKKNADTHTEAGIHPEPALLLLRYIAQEKLWHAPTTRALVSRLPCPNLHGNVLFSHWHLYCTSFCQKMRPIYFCVKAVELISNAPKCADNAHLFDATLRFTHHLRRLFLRIMPSAEDVRIQQTFKNVCMNPESVVIVSAVTKHVSGVPSSGVDDVRSANSAPPLSTSPFLNEIALCLKKEKSVPEPTKDSAIIGLDVDTSNYSSSVGEIEFVVVSLLDLVFKESLRKSEERMAWYYIHQTLSVLTSTCAHVVFPILFSLRTLSFCKECDSKFIMNIYLDILRQYRRSGIPLFTYAKSTAYMKHEHFAYTFDFFTALDDFCRQATQPVTATHIAQWLHDYCCVNAQHRKAQKRSGSDSARSVSTQSSTAQRYLSSNNILDDIVQCNCYGTSVFAYASSLFIKLPKPICNPFKPWILLDSVMITDIKVELSSSRPVWLVFSSMQTFRLCECPSPLLRDNNGTTCINTNFEAQLSLSKTKQSSSAASCKLTHTPNKLHKFLYKSENVGRDQLMCISARLLHMYLQEKIGPVPIEGYSVLPLSQSSGLIEHVEGHVLSRLPNNALTQSSASAAYPYRMPHETDLEWCPDDSATKGRSDCKNYSGGSSGVVNAVASRGMVDMSTYIKQCGSIARTSFYVSSKLFLLLNYIFSIGDRHQGNVMLSTTGSIMHIDFQFIFSEKTLVEKIAGTTMRVDDEFLSAVTACRREHQEEVDSHRDAATSKTAGQCDASQNATRSRDGGGHGSSEACRRGMIGAAPSTALAEKTSKSVKAPQQQVACVTMTGRDSAEANNRAAEHDDYFDEAAEWFLVVRPYAETFMQLWLYAVHSGILDFSEDDLASAFDTLFDRNASSQTSAANFANTMRYSINVCRLKDVAHNGVQALRSCANCMSRTISEGRMDVIRNIGNKMWSRWRKSNRLSGSFAHNCSDIDIGLSDDK